MLEETDLGLIKGSILNSEPYFTFGLHLVNELKQRALFEQIIADAILYLTHYFEELKMIYLGRASQLLESIG